MRGVRQRKSEPLLHRRLQVDRLLDIERQSKRLVILAPDLNRVLAANDVDVARFFGKSHGIRERSNAIPDLGVGPERGETGLLFHRIAKSIVLEKILAGVQPEVQQAAEDHELDETPEPARSTLEP